MAEERTAFVHLFEWSWSDIASECEEFLGPKGFAAVQVSPPQEHISGSQWWTRYQPVSYSLTSRSGDASGFADMVSRCNAVGVEIYVDAVINHMAAWDRNFPGVPFYSEHFNDCATSISDYSNRYDVQYCDLVGLNDLKTGSDYVRGKIADYLNNTISMGVSGFRIDAAKHMPVEDIAAIKSLLNNKPYIFQEVIDLGGEPITSSEYTGVGDVTEFKYSAWIGGAFKSGSISSLSSLGNGLLSSDSAVVFTDNHDNQRGHGAGGDSIVNFFLGDTYKLANVFMLAWPYGYPKVMSSYSFTDTDQGPPSSSVHSGSSVNCGNGEWVCEHRWTGIANMVGFRNATNGASVTNWWDNGSNQVAFGRDGKGFVVINKESGTLSDSFATGMPAGTYCNIIADDDCSQTVTVDSSGNANISVGGYDAVAFYVGYGAAAAGYPTAVIADLPEQVDVGTTITLDASDSYDEDGSIKSYKWSTGGTSSTLSVTLNTEGYQSFTVTVTDNDGNTGTATAGLWVGEKPATGNFDSLYFRGSTNSWGKTAMELVADNTWQLEIEFTGEGDAYGEQRFKVDETGDWSSSWGDANSDGILDQSTENDIYTDVSGTYLLTVNDETLVYTLTAVSSTVTPVTTDDAPVAAVSPSKTSVTVGESVTLSAAGSSDDNGITSYKWSTGGTSKTTTLSYSSAGTYQVTVTVTDSSGQTDTATATITVTAAATTTDNPPVAAISPATASITTGETLTLSAAGSTDDNGIASYKWSTGGTNKTTTVRSSSAGTYKVTVTVTDSSGQTDTASATITVTAASTTTDNPPVANIVSSASSVTVGQKISLSATSSSDDNGIASYLWSTGETSSTIVVQLSTVGTHSYRVTVTDTNGQSDTARVTLTATEETSTVESLISEAAEVEALVSEAGTLNWQILLPLGLLVLIRRRRA